MASRAVKLGRPLGVSRRDPRWPELTQLASALLVQFGLIVVASARADARSVQSSEQNTLGVGLDPGHVLLTRLAVAAHGVDRVLPRTDKRTSPGDG